jgi:hypothetical protein
MLMGKMARVDCLKFAHRMIHRKRNGRGGTELAAARGSKTRILPIQSC